MLKDVAPFEEVWRATRDASTRNRSVISFIRFLQKKLGGEFVYDMARIGYEPVSLAELMDLAEKFRTRGVLRSFGKIAGFPDEPRFSYWYAEHTGNGEGARGAGSAPGDDRPALTAALAEMLERFVWFEASEPFAQKRVATAAEMKNTSAMLPERFVGYSEKQRSENADLRMDAQSRYAWIPGRSLREETEMWVPVQAVSADTKNTFADEPLIRPRITTGLATHPLREEALLSGALEIIERDAFMIAWLNQLSLPRISFDELAKGHDSLQKLLEKCIRYRLRPHAIRLITDAPTYAFLVVIEDETESQPHYTVGLCAHRSATHAAEKALMEALRARSESRQKRRFPPADWNPSRKAEDVGHNDRLLYWSEPGRSRKLDFLVQGPEESLKKESWEEDSSAEHLARIFSWCKDNGYGFASVPLTRSKANVPNWHIEFVVIPELQPLYFDGHLPLVSGARLKEIPKKFGYKSREPFTDEPHPFY